MEIYLRSVPTSHGPFGIILFPNSGFDVGQRNKFGIINYARAHKIVHKYSSISTPDTWATAVNNGKSRRLFRSTARPVFTVNSRNIVLRFDVNVVWTRSLGSLRRGYKTSYSARALTRVGTAQNHACRYKTRIHVKSRFVRFTRSSLNSRVRF